MMSANPEERERVDLKHVGSFFELTVHTQTVKCLAGTIRVNAAPYCINMHVTSAWALTGKEV